MLGKLLKNFVTAVLCICVHKAKVENPPGRVPQDLVPSPQHKGCRDSTQIQERALIHGEGEVAECSVQAGGSGQFTDLEA